MENSEFDDRLDDAVHAVLQAFELTPDGNSDTADAISDSLRGVLQNVYPTELRGEQ